MHRKLAFLAALMMSAPSVAAPTSLSPDVAAATFDNMKGLVGEWRSTDAERSTLRIHFSLTAGGSVLVEEWDHGGRTHSLTLYHQRRERPYPRQKRIYSVCSFNTANRPTAWPLSGSRFSEAS